MENVKLPPLEVYTDGSCFNKEGLGSGPGGIGYVIKQWVMKDNVPVIETSEGSVGYKMTTNNRMEILAALTSINEILDGSKTGGFKDLYQINLCTDSKYLSDAISKNWIKKWEATNWMTANNTAVKNKDLWERFIILLNKLEMNGVKLSITHVYGHSGNVDNERADKLATDAAKDTDNHISDEVYEKHKGR